MVRRAATTEALHTFRLCGHFVPVALANEEGALESVVRDETRGVLEFKGTGGFVLKTVLTICWVNETGLDL